MTEGVILRCVAACRMTAFETLVCILYRQIISDYTEANQITSHTQLTRCMYMHRTRQAYLGCNQDNIDVISKINTIVLQHSQQKAV